MALMRGKVYWCKILGKPQPGYTEGDKALAPKEWSMDFTPDTASLATAAKLGFMGKIRNKADERGDFFKFQRKEIKGDGVTLNAPIPVVDHHGKPWNQKTLIGNGSTVNIKFSVYEGRKGNKPIILAVQVWDLVPYEGRSFPTKDDVPVTADQVPATPEEFPATEPSTEVA